MFKNSFLSNWVYSGLFIVTILSFIIHWDSLTELPSYIHARAQSDRFALALNYFHNGFNLFKSETYLFNVEFPHNFRVPKDNTIVSVDLPIHEYIIALIMKMIGDKSPIIFRLYMLIYSIVGLGFLLKIGKILNLGWVFSFLLLVFLTTIPVYVYYQDSFLPTITSFSNLLIATYFYLKYILKGQLSDYILVLLFLVLASLSRSIYVIPLLSVIGIESLFLLKKSINRNSIRLISISFLFLLPVLGQYLYNNNYMRYEYGSVFLYYLVPAENLDQLVAIIKGTLERWSFDFFTPIHYFFLTLLVGLVTYLGLNNRIKNDRVSERLLYLIAVSIIGYILFSLAMATKFPQHDYYFIDTFLIVFILFIIWSLKLIRTLEIKLDSLVLKWGILLGFGIPAITYAKSNFDERRLNKSWDNVPETIQNFKDINGIFKELKIEKEAKILVVGPYAPNLPLLMMDKKGYAAMHKSKEDMLSILNWGADYIVLQNELYLKEYYPHFPEFIYHLRSVYNNGNLTIAEKKIVPEKIQFEEFFNIEKGEKLESLQFFFEEDSTKNWTNINRVSKSEISNNLIGLNKKENEFGLTFKSENFKKVLNKKSILEISASIYFENQLNKASVVSSISNKKGNVFYQSELLTNLLDTSKSDQWQKINLSMKLPEADIGDEQFSFYMWNNKEEFYIDSIKLDFYSLE